MGLGGGGGGVGACTNSPPPRSKELALVTLDEQVNSETQSVREVFALPIIAPILTDLYTAGTFVKVGRPKPPQPPLFLRPCLAMHYMTMRIACSNQLMSMAFGSVLLASYMDSSPIHLAHPWLLVYVRKLHGPTLEL